jgi:hypothetical protein
MHFISFLLLVFGMVQPDPVIKKYAVAQAQQAVAVNQEHFYVINNSSIIKYLKSNGKQVAFWEDSTATLKHLNSGIVINNLLYCTNSNYPESPMASSLEVFDPETLQHKGNHSFGIFNGSATWIDFYQDHWYVAFAHYSGNGSSDGKDNNWTRLVKLDREWHQVESWLFPAALIERFKGRSSSGGFIHEGKIYCTGHDLPEVYLLEFPQMGFTLKWTWTHQTGSFGQGIAKDFNATGKRIWGINRKENLVVVSQLN